MTAEAPRRWTDIDGKFKHEATFVSLFQSGMKVKLRYTHNGAIVALPLDRLSEADKAYVRDAVARAKQKPGAEKEEMVEPSSSSSPAPPSPASSIASATSPLVFPQTPANATQPVAGSYGNNYQNQYPNNPPATQQPSTPALTTRLNRTSFTSSQQNSTSYYPMPQQPTSVTNYRPNTATPYQPHITNNTTNLTMPTAHNPAFAATQPVSYPPSAASGSPSSSTQSSPAFRDSIVTTSPPPPTGVTKAEPFYIVTSGAQQHPQGSPRSQSFPPPPQPQNVIPQQQLAGPRPMPTSSSSASSRQSYNTPGSNALPPPGSPKATPARPTSKQNYGAPGTDIAGLPPVSATSAMPIPTTSNSATTRHSYHGPSGTDIVQPSGFPTSSATPARPMSTSSNLAPTRQSYQGSPGTDVVQPSGFLTSSAAPARPMPTTSNSATTRQSYHNTPVTDNTQPADSLPDPATSARPMPATSNSATTRQYYGAPEPNNSQPAGFPTASATSNVASAVTSAAAHSPSPPQSQKAPAIPFIQHPDPPKVVNTPSPAPGSVPAAQRQHQYDSDGKPPATQSHIYAPALSAVALAPAAATSDRMPIPSRPETPSVGTPISSLYDDIMNSMDGFLNKLDAAIPGLVRESASAKPPPPTKDKEVSYANAPPVEAGPPVPPKAPVKATGMPTKVTGVFAAAAAITKPTISSAVAQPKVVSNLPTLPHDIFVHITQYLDIRSLVHLYSTSKEMRKLLRENPECWQYISFEPSYLDKVDHKYADAMVSWLSQQRLVHFIHSVDYDGSKIQELTVVQTLERFPALEHLSIRGCWGVYSYPLANLLAVRRIHRAMHLAMLKSFYIGNSLYRGTIPEGFPLVAESQSFGQDVGLIGLAITQLAGRDVRFDVYLCEKCEVGPCYPVFKCTFCGDVPTKKCWLCTPKCDRCGTRACGEAKCKKDWHLSDEHRCGRCGVGVRLCTNRGCIKTPTCNQCGRYFHARCNFETSNASNACETCEKVVCPFCDLDVCAECKGQWCRKNRCTEVVACQCGKGRVVCPKDVKTCASCPGMPFCSKCMEQHKQMTGHE
ncbi:hypothetical protein BC938DRAFT_481207 [Jimgerdemannia flammicorona]|uniref:F-box domain-containing protein n=1 Tax=Jimgerdemannia flammicorona TaxID=994334 RepID=A0A433QHC7_9FUNG|nr:hypothetical protein BC938DRAFT_481207 [Jimgerdemannia flammicorona]